MEHAYSYQEVLLMPRYSELVTRSDANTSVSFLGHTFKLPVVPANMLSVIDLPIARQLSASSFFYIYHRFGKEESEQHPMGTRFVEIANSENWKNISISVGVNEDSRSMLTTLAKHKKRIDFITIDVAHAHHSKVKEQIGFLRKVYPTAKLIVGNIATPEAYLDLVKWGADAVKVGIGQGSICSTRFQTGFSVPMFTCVQKIADKRQLMTDLSEDKVPKSFLKHPVPIISDGGIKHPGDIAKALVAGASMVMCGSLFARCSDSPAKIDSQGKKVYFGSTSFEAKGNTSHIEGYRVEVNVDVSYMEKLQQLREHLQSAISYAGGSDLSAFSSVTAFVNDEILR